MHDRDESRADSHCAMSAADIEFALMAALAPAIIEARFLVLVTLGADKMAAEAAGSEIRPGVSPQTPPPKILC